MRCSKGLIFILFFVLCITANTQENSTIKSSGGITSSSSTDYLPKISKDSTESEIITHIEATIDWMSKEHFKFNFVPPLIYSETAINLADKIKDKSYLHKTRSVVGNIMLRIKDTANAKTLFLKSLLEAEASKDSTTILSSKGNLANAFYYTGNYNHKAIANYIEGIEIAKQIKDTNRVFIMHHNVSRIFIENKDVNNTIYHVNEAAKVLKYIDNPFYKSGHLRNQGMMYVLLNQPDDAIQSFKENLAIAEEIDFMDGIIEGHQGYIEALEQKKDYKTIYQINKKLKSYTDKKKLDDENIEAEALKASVNILRYKEQLKSKELEKELLEHQAESKTLLLFFVSGIVVFLLITLIVIFTAYKKRKKLIKNLRDKNKQYLKAKKESDELAKAKSKFFATVSHELRTPLYGVIGLSSILLDNNDLKKHEKDLKSLKFSANYLLTLINDLLNMNKIDSDNFTNQQTIFNLKNLTHTIVSTFEYVRLQHQNKIKVTIERNVPLTLKGNSVRLSQILMNLIGNACKFTEKGVIDINIKTLERDHNKVKLQFIIKDTGPGIEKDKLSQIFNEFTQIESASSRYQGTGLGLPIVKKLIEQAKGKINVESQIGIGTTFTFEINLLETLEIEQIKTKPILDFKQLANKRILVVEDNRINQRVTKRILESEDVYCEIAQNGEEAVNIAKQSYFDLILMDINMPLKNGIEATTDIRIFNKKIPIIALTAVEIEEQKQQIFDCGMNDIIVKPYDIDIFKKTIIANLMAANNNDLKMLG